MRDRMNIDVKDVLFEGEFDVKTDIPTTLRFLTYAELYPVTIEPGWEDGKAMLGEVRKGGTEFDVMMKDGKGGAFVCGKISNRQVMGNNLSYDF